MTTPRLATDRLQLEFIRSARRHWTELAMADSTGQRLTYGRALTAAFALARVLSRLTPDQDNVGILLPASVGGALTNIALLLAGRRPINLNFTIGRDALDASITQAGIRTIVTSKLFLTKAGLEERPGMIFLEDVRPAIRGTDKVRALLDARVMPMSVLRRRMTSDQAGGTTSPLATIIFSSGSTGMPKGVMLTHANILTNVDSFGQLFPLGPQDRFIGVLPFFHSFGFTCTVWFPLLVGAAAVYHPNPMDAKTVGELAATFEATMLVSTPTFCQAYLRRCTPEQFSHLKYAIVGAEKLREPLASEFRQTFGIDLLEGYGMTEMAPVVAVNRPDDAGPDGPAVNRKIGSVGRPIPGVTAKIVDQATGVDLPTGREGMLLVKGLNMMAGYLHDPDRTAEVIRDGWYVTGDIGRLDEDGFIFITDRVSRFSKIGGEMVPHGRVEDAINSVLGEMCAAVTSVPDASKGERLVAFYTTPNMPPETLWSRLADLDLPRLWLPRRDNLVHVEALPVLGTGKIDLRRLREMAREVSAAHAPDPR